MSDVKNKKPLQNGDEVLQEVWRIRAELSAKYGHDVKKLFEALREHQKESERMGFKVVDLSGERKKDANGDAE